MQDIRCYQNRSPIGASLGHPPPPIKILEIETLPRGHPPLLADGTHASLVHTIVLDCYGTWKSRFDPFERPRHTTRN